MLNFETEEAGIYISAIEQALREGFPGPTEYRNGGPASAVTVAARRLGIYRQTLEYQVKRGLPVNWEAGHVEDIRELQDMLENAIEIDRAPRTFPDFSVKEPARKHFIFTSAQNDTELHCDFFDNLRAYAKFLGNTEIMVGRFTYQTDAASDRARSDDKRGRREYKWDPRLSNYLTSERTPVGDALFCAEMNTLPTANRPLSGLHTYGQGRNVIFPHAKVALEVVALAHGEHPPIVMTTGCCTIPNYTDTKAGLKGEFHHVFGAVIIEVFDGWTSPPRHLIADNSGSFQDLDRVVRNGKIKTGQRVEAITYGDIHSPFIDADFALANWGFNVETWSTVGHGLVDYLRPKFQFFHDLIDHAAISHHEKDNTIARFKRFVKGEHLIETEITHGAKFLEETRRHGCTSVRVRSNHDRWLTRWLDRCDHRRDRANAIQYLRLELARHEAVLSGESFDVINYALSNAADLGGVVLLGEGEGFQICQDTGGIECGDHFDLGPNGSKGTPTSLARVSGKANGGDKHTPGIWDGVYIAGVACQLRREYNMAGPSSWRHANIITYPNGKRTILFLEKGRYRI